MTDYRWPAVTKDPDDILPMQLGLWALCATFWSSNEEYDLGDFAWPNITVLNGQIVKGAIGLVMECTGAGRSGSREPRWVTVADTPMGALDGSVQWTPRVGLLQGVAAISAATVISVTPADLTTSAVLVNEGTKVLLDYSGGTLGTTYEVELGFVIGGRQRTGRHQIVVAKK